MKVLHQAFVAVDEKGTEENAATSATTGPTSAMLPDLVMIVDRPFLFVISDLQSQQFLFIGLVVDPTRSGRAGKQLTDLQEPTVIGYVGAIGVVFRRAGKHHVPGASFKQLIVAIGLTAGWTYKVTHTSQNQQCCLLSRCATHETASDLPVEPATAPNALIGSGTSLLATMSRSLDT